MKIIIEATAKEIADLVRAIQDRQLMELQKELDKVAYEPCEKYKPSKSLLNATVIQKDYK